MEQARFRQIYRQKAMESGGYAIGGCPRGKRITCKDGKIKCRRVRGPQPAPKQTLLPGYTEYTGSGARRRRGGTSGNIRAARKSPWITFVKKYAKQHKMTYGEALSNPKTSAAYHRS